MDSRVTLAALKEKVRQFVEERDWQQYHTPKSLSMGLAIEAAELMELFLWSTNEGSINDLAQRCQEVENEVADIAFTLLNFCDRYAIDLSQALAHKMILNAQKYPVEKSRSKSAKYTEYTNSSGEK
jgi:dCTP diphosphatase